MSRPLTISILLIAAALPLATALAPPHATSPTPAGRFFSPTPQPHAGAAAPNLLYHGGPVLLAPKAYVTYWGWNTPLADPDGAEAYLDAFFQGVGGSPWANIQTQYYSGSAPSTAITNPVDQFGGSWHDNSLAPPPVDVGNFVAYASNEAAKAETHFGYDANGVYFVILPHGYDGDFAGTYCAYHAAGTDGHGNTFAWAVLPYVSDFPTVNNSVTTVGCGTGFIPDSPHPRLDGFSMTAGHEYAEAVTDPHINAWYDKNGAETGDKCQFVFSGPGRYQEITLSTGTFGVQGLWSNAANGCVAGYP